MHSQDESDPLEGGSPVAPGGDFRSAWAVASNIEGWLTEKQAQRLFDLARLVKDGQWIVEIGSHKGKSTVILGRGKPVPARLLAVDPFDDPRWGGGQDARAFFMSNLATAGLAADVTIYQGTSIMASRDWSGEPIGLLFVDGAHDRPSVLSDIDEWEPHIAPGGAVAFHDAFSSVGVTYALLQRHYLSRTFLCESRTESLVVFKRTALSTVGALLNMLKVTGQLPYFARNIVVKISLRRGWHRLISLLQHEGEGAPY